MADRSPSSSSAASPDFPSLSSAKTPLRVCFIAGAGHSGSTLLGLLLGSHSQGFYGGEMAKSRFLQDPAKPLRKRVCKFCGPECPVWGDFWPQGDRPIHRQLADRVQRPLIIDSTKNLDWIQTNLEALAAAGTQGFLIFLQRDGRAVVNSRRRKYPEQPFGSIVEEWMTQIQKTQAFFAAATVPKIALRYEQLATQPQVILQELCQFLQLPWEPTMVDFYRGDHHVLGGNNGTQFLVNQGRSASGLGHIGSPDLPWGQLGDRHGNYYQHPGQPSISLIRLDLRWKEELPPEALQYFTQTAQALNQDFAWD